MSNALVVIGGGAAGFFGAIACAEATSKHPIVLLERGSQLLAKVRISGGGRCNVTHACFDPAKLVTYYPRGGKALRGPFTRFQPQDTIAWFRDRGIQLKTEPDGRMFPVTDSSQTIIECLDSAAKDAGVEIRTRTGVDKMEKSPEGFPLQLTGNRKLTARKVLIATGSNRTVWNWLASLGHTIIEPVPSLFTFNVPTSPLKELSGISVENAEVTIPGTDLRQRGPLLITHWGFSGPAVLKMSAWGARILHDCAYQATLRINWLPRDQSAVLRRELVSMRDHHPSKLLGSEAPVPLPRNLWRALLTRTSIDLSQRWAATTNQQLNQIVVRLQSDEYAIDGKTTYKEEFVTCGGVNLDEVNFKTMESKICKGLYFAGEVLDIDGVTGGFNFQSAWTTGYLAGTAMSVDD